MFSAGIRHHSSSNLQHHQIVGGSRVSGYPSNTGTRPGEMGVPNRTQSQNSLPHIPPNGHMLSGQLRSHTSAGSTFAEIFESKVSHLQDLEETFVWWCRCWVELASINQLSLLYHVSKSLFQDFFFTQCVVLCVRYSLAVSCDLSMTRAFPQRFSCWNINFYCPLHSQHSAPAVLCSNKSRQELLLKDIISHYQHRIFFFFL